MSSAARYQRLNTLPLWEQMEPIDLEQMRAVKLMNRVDTKYVASEDQIMEFLGRVAECGYKVQVIDGVRAARYDTRYFDTEDRAMYIAHHNQQLTRQKIRTRHYEDGSACFLEVKNKNNRGRTKKVRIEIPQSGLMSLDSVEAATFLSAQSRYEISTLSPALSTRFVRITVVNPNLTERITIDLDLEYCDLRNARSAKIEGVSIVEIKQDGNIPSMAKEILLGLRVKPMRISKYCLGTALTVEGIKRNRMLQKMRNIEKRIGYNKIVINNL
jgi:hypothetical protein